LKVLIPIGSIYPSQQGGPSNSMYWLAYGLVNSKNSVTIVSTDIKLDASIPRDRWISSNYGQLIFNKERFHSFPIKSILCTWRAMKQVDIVHLNSIFYPFSFLSGIMALVLNKNIVWSVRGELDNKALIYSKIKKKIYLYFFKKIFSKRVVFHVTANDENEFCKKYLGNINTCIIPNYMILPKKINCEVQKYISYIGRIHPKKAIENLIKAVNQSKNFKNSKFVLKIAGAIDNQYAIDLVKLVSNLRLEDQIQFIGHIEKEEKEIFLSKSYFSFMPSHTENFGLVVTEALAQGTPVVASKASPWKSLEDNKCGFWVDNSIETLASTIDYILEMDSNLYKEYRINAFNLSKEFDIDLGIKEWVEIYNSIINK
jgi:glycosyltransferase involved in cell wall biosynthesis